MEFRELEDDKLEDEGKVLGYINDIFTLEFSVSEGTCSKRQNHYSFLLDPGDRGNSES